MSLRLVELEVDWMKVLQGASVRDGIDPGYHLHAWISGLFGSGKLQPFEWVKDRNRLYGYTTETANDLIQYADTYAGAEARAALKSVHEKVLPEPWPTGIRVGFRLRAVPSVRLAKGVDGRAPKGGEVDAYNAARWRGVDTTRAEVYEGWLRSQLDRHGSVNLTDFRLQGHQIVRMVRRTQGKERRPRSIALPEMRCTGVVAVTDPKAFSALLARGVGRHRAFGFGMLLLRPPC